MPDLNMLTGTLKVIAAHQQPAKLMVLWTGDQFDWTLPLSSPTAAQLRQMDRGQAGAIRPGVSPVDASELHNLVDVLAYVATLKKRERVEIDFNGKRFFWKIDRHNVHADQFVPKSSFK